MREKASNSYRNLPDDNGRFGIHGGRFVAETLMPLVLDWKNPITRHVKIRVFYLSYYIIKNIILAGHPRYILRNG